MKKIINYLYITLFAWCFVLPTQAQTNNSNNLERELNLEKEYNPSLRDANKINQLPEIKEPEAPKTKVEFSNYTSNELIPPYLSNLKAQTYFPHFATSKKRGYLIAGVSTLMNIDGDLGYQLLNSDNDFLSIYASHRSSNSDVTYLESIEKQKMKINDNVGGLNYMHRFNKAKLFADAQYTYSGFNYYGYNDYFSIDQVNNMFQTHLGIASVNNEAITYQVNVAYTLLKQNKINHDIQGKTENRMMADFDLHTHFNSTTGIGLGGYVKNYTYTNLPNMYSKTIFDNSNYTTLSFNPYFTLDGDNWEVRLGASANMQTGEIEKFLIAPDVRFNWRPTDQFRLYILAEGGIKDNSNYNLFYENRYINPLIRVLDSKIPVDGTLGLNFLLLSNLEAGIFTGYKLIEDEHFYTENQTSYAVQANNLIYLNTMTDGIAPLYGKAKTFKLGGSFKYTYQDIFNLNLNLTYYNWQTSKLSRPIINEVGNVFNELQAYGKPNFVADFNMGFKIPSIPMRIDLAYHLETGRKKMDTWSINMNIRSISNMENIHDLNLKASYDINDTFSIFGKANNLLFQKYDLWYGYPAQDFNFMGGISVKF